MTAETTQRATPYASAAHTYHHNGWAPLPLPERSKAHPPTGWTGRHNNWPSGADITEWADQPHHANIGLRLPRNVIGIDVDAYPGKPGATTLHNLETAHGTLPPTWRTTSRDDGTSGIRLYTVPEGLRWPSIAGPGIEIIQWAHRYAVVWPSIHPEGRTYRWHAPQGHPVLGAGPTPTDLTPLPQGWVDALTAGRLDDRGTHTPTDATPADVKAWLGNLPGPQLCGHTIALLTKAHTTLTHSDGTSRHDTALHATYALVHAGANGHTGTLDALHALHAAWLTALAGTRTPEEADAEWTRSLTGAVHRLIQITPADTDPCTNPFAGLIDTPTPLVAPAPSHDLAQQEAPPQTTTSEGPQDLTDVLEVPRTTWWPTDLNDAFTGAHTLPPPTHAHRNDGQALFYSGRINNCLGESESGKTWLAIHTSLQAIHRGEHVTFIDFEDTAAGLITRLRDAAEAAHVTETQLRAHLSYIGPDQALDAAAAGDLTEHLTTHHHTHNPAGAGLIVVDGVNAAMTLLGLDLISNTDATTFTQKLLRPLADTGACVLSIDHLPKASGGAAGEPTKGGIGAQAKRAMTNGCAIRADVLEPFGRGKTGRLKLTVDKDRPGHVRGAADGNRIGILTLASDPTTGAVTLTLAPPDGRTGRDTADGNPDAEFRPTRLMEKVSHFLSTVPDGASGRTVTTEVGGYAQWVRRALEALVQEGYVRREQGPRNSLTHHLVRPFTEAGDTLNDPSTAPKTSSASECVSVRLSASETHGPSASPRVRLTGPSPTGPDALRDALEESADAATNDPSASKDPQRPVEDTACHRCGDLDAAGVIDGTCNRCRGKGY